MSKFLIKFGVEATDFQAAAILDHLFDAFTQTPDIGPFTSFGVVIVPDAEISEEDIVADARFNDAVDALDSAGIDIDPNN